MWLFYTQYVWDYEVSNLHTKIGVYCIKDNLHIWSVKTEDNNIEVKPKMILDFVLFSCDQLIYNKKII